jgi:hypothetical protein
MPQVELDGQHHPLRQLIDPPAWGMVIAGISIAVFAGIYLLREASAGMSGPDFRPNHWMGGLSALATATFLVLGGLCLKKRVNYRLVKTMSILAMMPWSPAALAAIPFGIWALVTLRKPEVQAAFHPSAGSPPMSPPLAAVENTPIVGPAFRKVRSFVGSIRSLVIGSRIDRLTGQQDRHIPTRDYQRLDRSEPPPV